MKKQIKNTIQVNKYLLVVFVLLSILIKFYQIGYRSFSLDELYGVVAGLEPNYNIFLENWVLYDSNPPLYYFFLRFWLRIVPATEFWVRLPSVIFVILACFVFVKGIKNRFKNTEWFYLSLLLGSSFGFLFFAQEARAYGLLFLFVSLQILCFIDLIDTNEPKFVLKKLILFSLWAVLASYTHYTGIVFSGILFFILIFIHRKKNVILKQFLLSVLVCFIAGLPWLTYFLFILRLDKSFIINQNYTIINEIVAMLFFGYSSIGKLFTIAFLLVLPIAFLFSLKKIKAMPYQNKIMIFLGMLCCSIILLSPIIRYFYYYRHYMILIPAILLMISIVLSIHNNKYVNNSLLCIGILIIVSQGSTFYKSKREEWRQAVK